MTDLGPFASRLAAIDAARRDLARAELELVRELARAAYAQGLSDARADERSETRLLSARHVAELLDCSVSYARSWLLAQRIEPILLGQERRYAVAAIQAALTRPALGPSTAAGRRKESARPYRLPSRAELEAQGMTVLDPPRPTRQKARRA